MFEQYPSVLIVEDSPTQAEKIAAALSRYDVQVIIANDGAQGLRIVAAQQPDLIVLDVNMPKMNGYQMCQRIRRDPMTARLPVILCTTENTDDALQKGIDAGADGYIIKDGEMISTLLTILSAHALLPEAAAHV